MIQLAEQQNKVLMVGHTFEYTAAVNKVEAPPYYDSYAEFHFSYRYGDIYTPRLNEYEPLRRECEHFLECIQNGKTPRSDGYSGLRVVSILEATDRSLKAYGAQQKIDYPVENQVA